MIDLIKEIGAIDLTLIAFYAIAIRYTARAVVPSIAFMLTIALSFADMSQDLLHACYSGMYIIFTIFKGTKNGQLGNVDRIALFSAVDLYNAQTHSKTETRR